MASKKSGKRAAAAWDSPLVKRRNDLIQREVRYLADEGEDLPRVLLQWRSTPSTGHGFESPVFTKALHPPDRRTDADIKLFSRLPSGSSFLHEVDDARSQLTRIRFMHWPALRQINALELAPPACLRKSQFIAVGTCCRSSLSASVVWRCLGWQTALGSTDPFAGTRYPGESILRRHLRVRAIPSLQTDWADRRDPHSVPPHATG